MDKEKQIEEMAKIIQKGEIDRNRGDLDCSEFTTDVVIKVGLQRLAGAKALCNAGYRKSSDVAREIFEEIAKIIQHHDELAERDKSEYGELIVMDIGCAISELKKKYTEEGK